MLTIIPPNRRQAAAALEEGDELADGAIISGVIAHYDLLITDSHGRVFIERNTARCAHHHRPMSELEALVHPRYLNARPDWSMVNALDDMAMRAGFTFFPRQRDYIAHLAKAGRALIAAEVGCGKTLFSLSLIHLLKPKRAIIIAPQGVITARGELLSQWEIEFQCFLPWVMPRRVSDGAGSDELGVHITYMQEALLNGEGWLSRVAPDHYDLIIVDEAHLLSNRDTIMAKRLFRMQPAYRYALTATPVGNRLSDCTPLCGWLRPGVQRAPVCWWQKLKWFRPLEVSPMMSFRMVADVIAPIRKADLRPDLPPLHIHRITVQPEAGFMERYQHLAKTFTLPDLSDGMIKRIKLTKLRNLCAESTAKIEEVGRRMIERPGVCISARTKQTTAVRGLVGERAPHLKTGRIDSTVPASQASSVSTAFKRGELDALFMGIKVAYGHSFPDCDVIHIASLEWDYGTFEQAVGRVYRINSQRPVHAFVYLLAGTIEEQMFDLVCAKQSAAMAVLYGEKPVRPAPTCA